MSEEPFHLTDEPTELSVSLLVLRLRTDSDTKGVSPKNYAHRLRVIRQQTELLARNAAGAAEVPSISSISVPAGGADEKSKALAKRTRKAARAPDHREEGGQG